MNDALWTALSAEDKEKIEYWIEKYGGNSAYELGPHAPLFDILSAWNASKRNLWEMFDHEFILSRDVEIKAIEDELIADLNTMRSTTPWTNDMTNFIQSYGWSVIDYNYVNDDNRVTSRYDVYYRLHELFNNPCLISNRYEGSTFSLLTPDRKIVKIQSGCKVSKALHTIQEKFNVGTKEDFEDFRIKHSQILNTKTLRGKLHLSIHPLDYMTMSDNACGWDSCMNWVNRGDYRMGTIEMMNSPMVICAYLDSEKPFYLDDGEDGNIRWSNKKWRELFIVNKDLLLGIKGYPYINRELESICLEWIKELIEAHPALEYGPYMSKIMPFHNDAMNNYAVEDTNELRAVRLWINCNYMYNDIYDEHFGYINPKVDCNLSFNYSGESTCLACGRNAWEDHCDDYDAYNLVCYECNDMVRCSCCGDWYYIDDMRIIDGEYYCNYCYDEYTIYCGHCGQLHKTSNSYRVYLTCGGKYTYYHDNAVAHICYECWEDFKQKYHIHYERFDTCYKEWVVDIESCSWDEDSLANIAETFDTTITYLRDLMKESKNHQEQVAIDEDVTTDLEILREEVKSEEKPVKLILDDTPYKIGYYSPIVIDDYDVTFEKYLNSKFPSYLTSSNVNDMLSAFKETEKKTITIDTVPPVNFIEVDKIASLEI